MWDFGGDRLGKVEVEGSTEPPPDEARRQREHDAREAHKETQAQVKVPNPQEGIGVKLEKRRLKATLSGIAVFVLMSIFFGATGFNISLILAPVISLGVFYYDPKVKFLDDL